MKQLLFKKLTITALMLCTLPVALLAQTEKEKTKTKEKTERQQIVITRTGDKEEKTVIEINGDKVKVNGKDVADLKDIQVHVNDLNIPNMRFYSPGQNSYTMSFDDNGAGRLYKVDSNRAMLGVITSGDDKGAEIQSITKESAAEKGGLKKGDVITKIDSRKIESPDDVTDAIRSHKPGDKVAITYLRDNKEYKATAQLGRWKGIDVKTMSAPRIFSNDAMMHGNGQGFAVTTAGSRPRLGMSVQDTDDGKGVKVLDVHDEGTADKAGIKEDDIILQIDGVAVNGADEVSKIMKDKKDQPVVKLLVNRSGKQQTIEVKIPRKLKTIDM